MLFCRSDTRRGAAIGAHLTAAVKPAKRVDRSTTGSLGAAARESDSPTGTTHARKSSRSDLHCSRWLF